MPIELPLNQPKPSRKNSLEESTVELPDTVSRHLTLIINISDGHAAFSSPLQHCLPAPVQQAGSHLHNLPDFTLSLQLLQLHLGRPDRLVAAQEAPVT